MWLASSSRRVSYVTNQYTNLFTISCHLRKRVRNYGRNFSCSCLSFTSAADTKRTQIWNSSIPMRIIVKSLLLASCKPFNCLFALRSQSEERLLVVCRALQMLCRLAFLWCVVLKMGFYSKASKTFVWYSAHISPCRHLNLDLTTALPSLP